MLIDLSVSLDEKTPVYPGDPVTNIKKSGQIPKDGYNDHYVSIGTHVGTHIDAPNHMFENGKTLNQFPIDTFVGRGKVVALTDNKYDLEQLKSTNIQQGDIVIFYSGLSNEYHKSSYFENYPAMPQDIADYLVEQKVKMVGLDMCSPDRDEFIAHKTLLGADILIIENLTNLKTLEGRDFTVYALPINLTLDGAPARVIAEV